MPFRIRYHPRLNRRIRSWQLPDPVFIEVYLRFHRLENDPLSLLRRVDEPFDGMVYTFDVLDPENRLRRHIFCFAVVYSQDEESLIIENGTRLLDEGFF